MSYVILEQEYGCGNLWVVLTPLDDFVHVKDSLFRRAIFPGASLAVAMLWFYEPRWGLAS